MKSSFESFEHIQLFIRPLWRTIIFNIHAIQCVLVQLHTKHVQILCFFLLNILLISPCCSSWPFRSPASRSKKPSIYFSSRNEERVTHFLWIRRSLSLRNFVNVKLAAQWDHNVTVTAPRGNDIKNPWRKVQNQAQRPLQGDHLGQQMEPPPVFLYIYISYIYIYRCR